MFYGSLVLKSIRAHTFTAIQKQAAPLVAKLRAGLTIISEKGVRRLINVDPTR
jgi:hypothetical protein